MMYTLNTYGLICQLDLNKAGKNKYQVYTFLFV